MQLSAADSRRTWEISVDAMQLLRSRIDRRAIEFDYVPGHLILAVNARKAWAHRVAHAYSYPLQSIGAAEVGNWSADGFRINCRASLLGGFTGTQPTTLCASKGMKGASDVKIEAIDLAYRRYARGYDLYFGGILQPGRRAVIERMDCHPGEGILEVGVGTGLSLPLYPPQTQVYGIDICHEMLARAKARVAREHLKQVAGLYRMDAEHMGFADDSFDRVVAMYVVSVAPDPVRLVDEMRRVCKPQGELFIVNHFLHPNPVVSVMERLAAPLSCFLGFNPNLSLHDFTRQARVEVLERLPVNAFGYWILLRARNNKQG